MIIEATQRTVIKIRQRDSLLKGVIGGRSSCSDAAREKHEFLERSENVVDGSLHGNGYNT